MARAEEPPRWFGDAAKISGRGPDSAVVFAAVAQEEFAVFVTIAHHYPRPEHVGPFLAFMAEVEAGMAGTPGLHSLESYRDVVQTRLVAIGRWESPEAAQAGVPRLMSIGRREPEWSARPDEVFQLELVSR